jgi:hypothetical protein
MQLTGRARVGLLAVLLVGLLAGGAYSLWGRAQGAPVLDQQPLTQTEFFPDMGERFVPAPDTATPQITAAGAFNAYLDDAVPPGLDKQTSEPPVVSLAIYTSKTGETSGIAPTLVWLIKFGNTPVVEFGPDITESKGTGTAFRCPFYVIIDATSGKRLKSFQTCDAPTTS